MLNLAMFSPANRELKVTEGKKADSGAQSISAKRMSRKEYADANKLDKNAFTFDEVYRTYLKSQESHGALLVEGARANGLIFAATSARKDKDGNLIGLSVRFSKPPTEKKSASATKMAELEAQNKEMAAKLEELMKLLPAPKAETAPELIPAPKAQAPAPAPKK